jgi:3-oxoacyl-(acyl-carrier-protein) synthase
MDLASQLALLAVESLGLDLDALPRERIAICLAASTGSLSTDLDYWNGRDAAGGPSPTLFAYTLPSAAIGEIAIRHRLTGPNLCFVGGSGDVMPEAAELIRRGEADGCVCVYCSVVSPELAPVIGTRAKAEACAVFLCRGGGESPALGEFDRDMELFCAKVCAR